MEAPEFSSGNDCPSSDLNLICASDSRPNESTHLPAASSGEDLERTQYIVAPSIVGSNGESLPGDRKGMTTVLNKLHVSESVALHDYASSCAPSDAPAPSSDMDQTVNKFSTFMTDHALPVVENRSESIVFGSRKLDDGASRVEPSYGKSQHESENVRLDPHISVIHADHIHSDMGTSPNNANVNQSLSQSDDGHLTPEERTKQRRMLRNRESAARSRDKRKHRNLELESSIAKLKASSENMQYLHAELTKLIGTMKAVVKNQK
jgi:hypothetical protein